MNTTDSLHFKLKQTITPLVTVVALGGLYACAPRPSKLSSSSAPLSPLARPSLESTKAVMDQIDQQELMNHIEALSVQIGQRPPGSPNEMQAAQYVATQLQQWGYEIELQPFSTTSPTGESLTSHNVIATRPGDDQWLVIGAHIDSVPESVGAVDNATGVAAMLSIAKFLSQVDSPHTLVFVGFGAEELGVPHGSEYYVQSLPETSQIMAMLNIDAIGAGKYPYVHAGATVHMYLPEDERVVFTGGSTWVRELALDVAQTLKMELRTAPSQYWNGYTGAWSDHYAFVEADVPIAYFEAWDWHGDADNPWWGKETDEGDISNTTADTLDQVIPEKVEQITEIVAGTALAIATGLAP